MKTRIKEFLKKVPLVGKPYVQRDELRAVVNQLWQLPGHFYSPIPSVEEIRRAADTVFRRDSKQVAGIDLNESEQLTLLQELTKYYDEQPFTDQKQEGLRYWFENPAFTYFDGIILHCMIRHARPRRIVEVGSGYSSCVFLDTNELFFGNSISCTFVEPYPQLLESLITAEDRSRIRIVPRRLQEVETRLFTELAAGDILFIDSSHVSKTNSDVNYVFFDILPRIQSGVYIQVHDIFFPFEYPKEWVYQGRAWNEAYVLRAFLQYNETFKIQLFNSFLERFHQEKLGKMPLCRKYAEQSSVQTSGHSIWLKRM